MQNTQDWDTFTILTKKHNSKVNKKDAKDKAFRSGNIETYKKTNIGNKILVGSGKKLDDELGTHETINRNKSKIISQARAVKGYSQEKLANLINQKKALINDYESGKAMPNNKIMRQLETKLGVILTGGDSEKWGKPLSERKQ
jgi:putative transcription factor